MGRSTTLLSVAILMFWGMIGTANAGEGTDISLWPRSNTVPFGHWSKLAGTAFEEPGVPVEGDQVTIEYWNVSGWSILAVVAPNNNGYFQHWFYTEHSPGIYRARHTDGTISNQATIELTENIVAWNNYRPITRYNQWTKVHGKYGGSFGPKANETLFLQRLYKYSVEGHETWFWVTTVKTDANGYYSAWFKSWSTETYRMGTYKSAVTSNTVTKTGATATAWANSKIHVVLKDGFGDPVKNQTVYLSRYGEPGWSWEGGGTKTSSTGYANFSPPESAIYRVVTWWSALHSEPVEYTNPDIVQELTRTFRGGPAPNPDPNSRISVFIRALDQDGNPIKGVKVATTWHYKDGDQYGVDYTAFNGIATTIKNAGDESGYQVDVDIAISYKGKTLYRSSFFTPN